MRRLDLPATPSPESSLEVSPGSQVLEQLVDQLHTAEATALRQQLEPGG